MNQFDELGEKLIQMDSILFSWVEKLGVGFNHFAVLYTLVAERNGCTQKKVCEEWGVPKQTVFNICKEYREKGWVVFQPSETDKRERLMMLTDAGSAEAEPLYAQTQAVFDCAMNKFGKRKTAQLFALIDELSQLCQAEIDIHKLPENETT